MDHLLSMEHYTDCILSGFEGASLSSYNPFLGYNGAVAQLGERLPCKQEVIGSIPFSSTKRINMFLENWILHVIAKDI